MYKDLFGREYESYEAYCNSDYLDTDFIASYLWSGKRKPQNEEEEELLAEMLEIERGGIESVLNFDQMLKFSIVLLSIIPSCCFL